MTRTAIIKCGAGGMGLAAAKIMGRDHRLAIADVRQEQLDADIAELTGLGIDARGRLRHHGPGVGRGALRRGGRGRHGPRSGACRGREPQDGSAEAIVRINALGTINLTEAFLTVASEGAALVNVASIAGHMAPRLLIPKWSYRLALSRTSFGLGGGGRCTCHLLEPRSLLSIDQY